MFKKILITVFSLLVAAPSFAVTLNSKNVAQLKVGMSRADVETILEGKALTVFAGDGAIFRTWSTSLSEPSPSTITIKFLNGKLKSIELLDGVDLPDADIERLMD